MGENCFKTILQFSIHFQEIVQKIERTSVLRYALATPSLMFFLRALKI